MVERDLLKELGLSPIERELARREFPVSPITCGVVIALDLLSLVIGAHLGGWAGAGWGFLVAQAPNTVLAVMEVERQEPARS